MTILNFPNVIPDIQDFGVKYLTQVSGTSLTQIIQTVEMPGARWHGTMQFRDLPPTQAAELKAFLLKLRGASGRFFFGDLELTAPQSSVTGTPYIQSGSTARDIIVSGHTGDFSVGDRIQIGDEADTTREYKMVVEVNSSDSLRIEPMMRRTDYVGKEVIYSNPVGVFLLDSDDHGKWSLRSKAKLSDIAFGFVEAFV